jgi:hypothetical protein
MGKLFSLIKPVATKFITAMVQKQVQNTVAKIGQGVNAEIFGEKTHIVNVPFNNNVKKQFPNVEKLPHVRALNERQRKRQEEKQQRKLKRIQEVKEKKSIVQAAGDTALEAATDQINILTDSALTIANNIATEAINQVANAAALAMGILESYKRVFSDLGTSGDKVVENSIDLIKTMVAAAPAIIGTCALGPTVTPGALPQFIFAVKSKSDALGTELSKFKSALNELKGIIKGLGEDFELADEILKLLDTVDTLTIAPQALIMATGGLVCLLEVDIESVATTALEGLVGEMAGPLMALATNDAALCDNWECKSDIWENLTDEEKLEMELDWSKHTWSNCANFQPMEYSVVTDENGIPKSGIDGKIMYELDAKGNKVPKYEKSSDGRRKYSECENCKKYKKNDKKAEEKEGK